MDLLGWIFPQVRVEEWVESPSGAGWDYLVKNVLYFLDTFPDVDRLYNIYLPTGTGM